MGIAGLWAESKNAICQLPIKKLKILEEKAAYQQDRQVAKNLFFSEKISARVVTSVTTNAFGSSLVVSWVVRVVSLFFNGRQKVVISSSLTTLPGVTWLYLMTASDVTWSYLMTASDVTWSYLTTTSEVTRS